MNARSAATSSRSIDLPLNGLLVLDFSQFLSGPSCALRLADLGANVVKVERPGTGELCRQLYLSDLEVEGDSALFHSINRNKRSFAADLKNPDDLTAVKRLIAHADVIVQNFRPAVMERLGLGYDAVRAINPRIVYGAITGYGAEGPWTGKPGQDLLAQSLSGLPWLSGDADDGPVPVGVAIADIMAGAHLAQGILACLVRRGVTGQGGRVDVSLLESTLDFQFQEITTFLNGSRRMPPRGRFSSASVYLGAPYGVYRTEDGYIAIAMKSDRKAGATDRLPRARALRRIPRHGLRNATRSRKSCATISRRGRLVTGSRFSSPPTYGAPTCSLGRGCSSTTRSKP